MGDVIMRAPDGTETRISRADWDEMQRLMHQSFDEALPGEDARETPSGRKAVELYDSRLPH